jgi:hypothetical protein
MNMREFWQELKLRTRVIKAAVVSIFAGEVTPVGRLYATRINADGTRDRLGLISTKVVTDAGVAFIVDAFQAAATLANMKYHGSGTSGTAENVTDTALGVEVESRATGTTAEGATANIFQTVATISYTATRSIVEHGIFSASTAGTLLDRSVFASIGVVSGDAIEFTYELTFPAGS